MCFWRGYLFPIFGRSQQALHMNMNILVGCSPHMGRDILCLCHLMNDYLMLPIYLLYHALLLPLLISRGVPWVLNGGSAILHRPTLSFVIFLLVTHTQINTFFCNLSISYSYLILSFNQCPFLFSMTIIFSLLDTIILIVYFLLALFVPCSGFKGGNKHQVDWT